MRAGERDLPIFAYVFFSILIIAIVLIVLFTMPEPSRVIWIKIFKKLGKTLGIIIGLALGIAVLMVIMGEAIVYSGTRL
jgi:hypothetical protein